MDESGVEAVSEVVRGTQAEGLVMERFKPNILFFFYLFFFWF